MEVASDFVLGVAVWVALPVLVGGGVATFFARRAAAR
jgi:hypothetical protein